MYSQCYPSYKNVGADTNITGIITTCVNALLMIGTLIVVGIRFSGLISDNLVNAWEIILLIVIVLLTLSNIALDVMYFLASTNLVIPTSYDVYKIIGYILAGIDGLCIVFYLLVIILVGFKDVRLTLPLFGLFLIVAAAEAACTICFVLSVANKKPQPKSSIAYMPVIQLIPQPMMRNPHF